MSNIEIREEENKEIAERFALVSERLFSMQKEEMEWFGVWKEYFSETSKFLRLVINTWKKVQNHRLPSMEFSELKKLNQELYKNFVEENNGKYYHSFAYPEYAMQCFQKEYGKEESGKELSSLVCFLFAELQGLIGCAFENKQTELTMYLELYLEIYGLIQQSKEEDITWLLRNIKEAISSFYYDYCEFFIDRRTREMLDIQCDFAVNLICHADLKDLRYLYQFGEYITESQLKTAEFLNSLSQKEIDAMANTFVEGFRLGFVNGRIDMSSKHVVNIRYVLGFERLVRAEIEQFEKLGLKSTIYRKADFSINRRQAVKVGYYGGHSCDQFLYDHRMDQGIYLKKGFVERKLMAQKRVWETYQKLAEEYAGPAVMEIFGETPFIPKSSENAIQLTPEQQKLSTEYHRQAALLQDQYIPGDKYSFTIIAYPIPEIGDKFNAIFHETIKVNTLSQEKYCNIQQRLIDVLDFGDYIHVTGKNGNRTDIKIMLHALEKPEKQTNFENCVADVNIPVGEVFTTPVLKGTEGILHVSEVYLEGLCYKNLVLKFKDGMVIDYLCENFDSLEENKKYIQENILFHHKTLPIGEFAIGTNTTAYRMGKDYQIFSILPILIAEKTGPHFALGDTCYSMSEDHIVYNPDGKEVIARENECSILRKTEPEKAYFNCHTDITIPYDELGQISVHGFQPDGKEKEIFIIDGGKFVLPGTEALNQPLERTY